MKITSSVALAIFWIVGLSGCGENCQSFSSLQQKYADKACAYMPAHIDSKGRRIHTWVCSSQSGDDYFDWRERDGRLCYSSKESL